MQDRTAPAVDTSLNAYETHAYAYGYAYETHAYAYGYAYETHAYAYETNAHNLHIYRL